MLQKCWECYKMLRTVIWTAKCCKMLRKAMKCCQKLQNVLNCQDVLGTAKCCEMSGNVSKCCELSGTVKCCEMLWNVLNCPELSRNDVILKLKLDIKVIPWTAERPRGKKPSSSDLCIITLIWAFFICLRCKTSMVLEEEINFPHSYGNWSSN